MTPKHILVVDDEANMRNTLTFILEAANYRVSIAESARKALQVIFDANDSNCPVDLIITDIVMPDMNGLELIDEIKRLNLELPILVITAYGNRKMTNELNRRGFTDYLPKPFQEDELINRVAALLTKKKEAKNGSQ